MTAARPSPLTIAMRAHMPWMTAIIGVVTSVSHNIEYPVDAPATEYVEMPEGSSSEAPVMNPGPRIDKARAHRAPIDIGLFGTFALLELTRPRYTAGVPNRNRFPRDRSRL